MQLTLEGVSQTVSGEPFLYPMSLALQAGQVTVLLGATQAGKTTLELRHQRETPTGGR